MIHGIEAPGPRFCPACGAEGTLRKAFAAPNVHFKGSGWAKKDRSTASHRARSKSESGGETGATKAGASGGDGSGGELSASSDKSSRQVVERHVVDRFLVDELGLEQYGRLELRPRLRLGVVRLGAGLTMAATDWISLEEAAGILVSREHPVSPGDDRRLGAGRQGPEHQARWPAVRPARRDQGARGRPAEGSRGGPPAGPVRGARGLSEARPPGRFGRLRERAGRILAWPVVATARRILDRYDAAGGGLLAGGLAYAALFAIVPAALLIAGVVGLVVADPAARQALIDTVVGVLPPMRDLIEVVLTELTRDRRAGLDPRRHRPRVGDEPVRRGVPGGDRAGHGRRPPSRPAGEQPRGPRLGRADDRRDPAQRRPLRSRGVPRGRGGARGDPLCR